MITAITILIKKTVQRPFSVAPGETFCHPTRRRKEKAKGAVERFTSFGLSLPASYSFLSLVCLVFAFQLLSFLFFLLAILVTFLDCIGK